VLGAGPLAQAARRVVDDRVVLLGDAAGYVDALTGEGLALGFAPAEDLSAAVVARSPAAGPAATSRSTSRGTAGASSATPPPRGSCWP
jgi:flavin-dependent dehydrogenase